MSAKSEQTSLVFVNIKSRMHQAISQLKHITNVESVTPVTGRFDAVVKLRTNDPEKALDRKSTRLNSSHLVISYAVFCLKKIIYPRFPAPVEFIAAVIAYYVHPVNIQTACLIMEGAEFTENIINCVERPVKAAELFAFTLRVRA